MQHNQGIHGQAADFTKQVSVIIQKLNIGVHMYSLSFFFLHARLMQIVIFPPVRTKTPA